MRTEERRGGGKEKGNKRIENDLTTIFLSSLSAATTTSSPPLLFPPLPYAVINPFSVRLGLLLTLPHASFKNPLPANPRFLARIILSHGLLACQISVSKRQLHLSSEHR